MGTIPQLSIIKGPTRSLQVQLLDRLFENVASGSKSSHTALIFEENGVPKKVSYEQLDKLTNKIARTINQLIINNKLPRNQDGDYIIAVNMHPSDRLIAILLGIWKSGCAYLPLDHGFPGPRIEHIIREARPVIVIHDGQDSASYLDILKLTFEDILVHSSTTFETSLNDQEKLKCLKDDLAIVMYTSGSTGVPKGVRLPHKIILNRLQWQFKKFPYSSTERFCIFKTALTFVDSVCEIWGPLLNGLTLVIVQRTITKDPEKLVHLIDEYQIERLVLVPSLLRSILVYLSLQSNADALMSLKTWVCSGETLAVSLAEEFFQRFNKSHKLCNFYGSTEIMGDVTYHVIERPEELIQHTHVPIGLPVDNTMIYLLDKDFRPVKAGDVGELFASGLNLAAGYVNGRDPEKFLDNPLAIDPTYSKLYRTGDFAKMEKGTLIYEGRTDSQVKIRGHRVDLSEVEKAVNSLDGVEKAVVLCYKPGEINQALLAFVTTKDLLSEHQIELQLKDKLTNYMIPQVVLLDTIPLLVNGKIDRQALLKMYENTNNNDDDAVETEISYEGVPTSQLQAAKDLFQTVAAVLGRSARHAISINANFYEIGGNSLNSIFTISRLTEKGYHINIGDFIAATDFGEVLQHMTQDIVITKQPPSFISEMLKPDHQNEVLDMITTSFYKKADLEQHIITEISITDYDILMQSLWQPLLDKNLSFVARNETGKIIAVSLNFDARDEPESDEPLESKLSIIFDFLEFIEGPVRDNQLPKGKGKILHSFMMGTHSSLTPRENVAVFHFLEEENLKLARSKGFAGIMTTNTSPLTQQLGTDVFGYQCMLDYQVNEYVAPDGSKPFGLAEDSQRAIVHWKPLD